MKLRIVIIAMALVLSLGILCACSGDDGDAKETVTGSAYTGTGDTLSLPDISVPEHTGTGKSDMELFYEEQYAQMTPEEIAQFEQDLKDLGLTKEQFYSLMYLDEGAAVTTADPEEETASAEQTTDAATTGQTASAE